jgi:aldose 1-epimerase
MRRPIMKNVLLAWLTVVAVLAIPACQPSKGVHLAIEKQLFGKLADGREVHSYTLTNESGAQVKIIEFGAVVVSLSVPDRRGRFADVVLGYDSLGGYMNDKAYLGAIVGRYGNRIAKGKFTLDGKEYRLATNNGENHLHGGVKGFDKVLWKAEPVESSSEPGLMLTYVSNDGEEGYPGTVTLRVTYTLTNDNGLTVDYEGATDKATILNPTQHSYFNLTGDPTKTVLDHELMIAAESFTPVDSGLIPTGELAKVEGTPFDFRNPTKIGSRINERDQQLLFGKGYDHNWVLMKFDKKVRSVATLYDSLSGRFMEVLTDQPGLQFYSGNFLDGTISGKGGVLYQHRTGLCLEAQGFPDSPNKPQFPSVVLRPGEVYRQKTMYKFSIK